MSDDWQTGDRALCVKGGPFNSAVETMDGYPVAGRIYIVGRFGFHHFDLGGWAAALWLLNGPRNASGDRVWGAYRFRKIHPHTPDEEDAETIRLLNSAPVQPETVEACHD